MAIDPTVITTQNVGSLPTSPINLTDKVPHEVGGNLKQSTVEDLAVFIAAYVGAASSLAFNTTKVTTGQTLPATTKKEFLFVGAGTFTNVAGGAAITTTQGLNVLTSNGSIWNLAVEVPVTVTFNGLVQTIRQGFTDTVTSEGAIFDALELIKADVIKSAPFLGAITPTTANAVTDNGYWIATQNGTYTNHGGFVLPVNTFAVIAVKNGVFSISQTALDLTSYVKTTDLVLYAKTVDVNKINAWTAKIYAVGEQVNYLGKDWTCISSAIATDTPSATSAKWTERLTEYANKKTGVNLVPNSILSLENTLLVNGASSNNHTWFTQNGTPTMTAISDFESFSKVLKFNVKVGDRANFLSQRTILNSSIINSSSVVTAGLWVKVPSNYTGVFYFGIAKTGGTINDTTQDVEFTQFANDWRFYRLKKSFSLSSVTDNLIWLMFYAVNTAGSVTADVYISNPTIIESKNVLEPALYFGKDNYILPSNVVKSDNLPSLLLTEDKIQGLNQNLVSDANFYHHEIGSTSFNGFGVWNALFGGGGAFQAPFTVVKTPTPVGDRALEIQIYKRSVDSQYTDLQAYNHIKLPEKYYNRTANASGGFWFKRESVLIKLFAIYFKCYSDLNGGTQLTSVSVTYDISSEVVGQWVFIKMNDLAIASGTKSVRIQPRIDWDTARNSPLNTIFKAYYTGFVFNILSSKITGYYPNNDERLQELTGVANKLYSKKWCSYGDSITAANDYQKYPIERFGLTHYLRGIGSTTAVETESIAWVDANGFYLARPPASQPAGSFQILSSMCNQQRIDTIPLDTEIITVFAGANDFFASYAPLGVITDETTTTNFYSAYQLMLNKIYARIPNAEVILVTMVHRKNEATILNNGKTYEEFREAIRLIGKKYKYRVIELTECGINKLNEITYLADDVHPNILGYERVSRLFIQEFAKIY